MAAAKKTTTKKTPTKRKATPPKAATPKGKATAKPAGDETAALKAQLATMAKQLETLTAKTAKAKQAASHIMTLDMMFEGASVPKSDWRREWLDDSREGYRADILMHRYDRKANTMRALEGEPVVKGCCVTLPRDCDPGGGGAEARTLGLVAIHWNQTESGEYSGPPSYVTKEELAELWVGP